MPETAEVVSGSPFTEPSGQSFLSDRYNTAIFCFSKGLPSSSIVPGVPAIPLVPAKEANALDALVSKLYRPVQSMQVDVEGLERRVTL